MTRPLRRSHFLIWLIVAPAAIGVLIAGLAARARVHAKLSEPVAAAEVAR